MPEITLEARQFAVDLAAAKQLSFPALVVRHTRTVSLLRTVCASRREWQRRSERQREPLAYIVLSSQSLATPPKIQNVRITATYEQAQEVLDEREERAEMDSQWFEGVFYLIGEIHLARAAKGEL